MREGDLRISHLAIWSWNNSNIVHSFVQPYPFIKHPLDFTHLFVPSPILLLHVHSVAFLYSPVMPSPCLCNAFITTCCNYLVTWLSSMLTVDWGTCWGDDTSYSPPHTRHLGQVFNKIIRPRLIATLPRPTLRVDGKGWTLLRNYEIERKSPFSKTEISGCSLKAAIRPWPVWLSE